MNFVLDFKKGASFALFILFGSIDSENKAHPRAKVIEKVASLIIGESSVSHHIFFWPNAVLIRYIKRNMVSQSIALNKSQLSVPIIGQQIKGPLRSSHQRNTIFLQYLNVIIKSIIEFKHQKLGQVIHTDTKSSLRTIDEPICPDSIGTEVSLRRFDPMIVILGTIPLLGG